MTGQGVELKLRLTDFFLCIIYYAFLSFIFILSSSTLSLLLPLYIFIIVVITQACILKLFQESTNTPSLFVRSFVHSL